MGPVEGRVLIVKVMVGGGRRSIRAPAELGPGEITPACVNELEGAQWMVVELPKCKGTRLEPTRMSGTACDVQPKSIDNGEQGCGRKS